MKMKDLLDFGEFQNPNRAFLAIGIAAGLAHGFGG